MQSAQVLISFDAATCQIQVQSPVSPAECLLLLERAKLMVVQQAFQPPKSGIVQATPDIEQALLNGRGHAHRS